MKMPPASLVILGTIYFILIYFLAEDDTTVDGTA